MYGIPSAIYGAEITEFNDQTIRGLHVAQNGMIRRIMRMPPWAKNIYLQASLQLMPLEYKILQMKMNYYNYVTNTAKDRWVSKALEQQEIWLSEHIETEDNNRSRNGYPWLIALHKMATTMNITVTATSKDRNKRKIWNKWVDNYRAELQMSPSLQYIRGDMAPILRNDIGHDKDIIIWHKARAGALTPPFLMQDKCRACNREESESLLHMMITCPATIITPRDRRLAQLAPAEITEGSDHTWITWWFHSERELDLKKEMGKYIRTCITRRDKAIARKETIEKNKPKPDPGTGGHGGQAQLGQSNSRRCEPNRTNRGSGTKDLTGKPIRRKKDQLNQPP